MSIKLRENEKRIISVKIHWMSYLNTGAWAATCLVGLVLAGKEQIQMGRGAQYFVGATAMFLFVGILPLLFRWLSNRSKHYVVTNHRLYIEEGILSKRKVDVPLTKINDVEMTQALLQRVLGAGNVLVLTGNDKPNTIKDIEDPEAFKEQLGKILKESQSQKAAA